MNKKIVYEARKRTIDILLNLPRYEDCPTLSKRIDSTPLGYYDACYIDETDPLVIGSSEDTLVLRLGNFSSGYENAHLCSKFYHIDRKYAPIGNIGIIGHSVNLSEKRVEKVARKLRKAGFSVPFHKQFFYRGNFTKFRNPAFSFIIAEDLTEGGLYSVKEAFDYNFSDPDLRQEYVHTVERLRLSGILQADSHLSTPSSAFEHMLFVRCDESGIEKDLVIGDLDHVELRRVH